MSESLGYGEAIAELESLLAELEVDEADVDLLAVRTRRAAELIRICRDRIDAARFEVERVVAGLDGSARQPDDAVAAQDAGDGTDA